MKNTILLEMIIALERGIIGNEPEFNLGYIQAIDDVRKILEKYDF